MAVTVTPANPSGASNKLFAGAYGPLATGVSVRVSEPFGNKRVQLTKLALSGTYITGGFALVPSAYGLKEIHGLAVVSDGTSGGAAVPQLTAPGASPVVKLVTDNVPTELGNATSVTNHTFTVLLWGI